MECITLACNKLAWEALLYFLYFNFLQFVYKVIIIIHNFVQSWKQYRHFLGAFFRLTIENLFFLILVSYNLYICIYLNKKLISQFVNIIYSANTIFIYFSKNRVTLKLRTENFIRLYLHMYKNNCGLFSQELNKTFFIAARHVTLISFDVNQGRVQSSCGWRS